MKRLRYICISLLLIVALCIPAFAGDIHCGAAIVPDEHDGVAGEISCPGISGDIVIDGVADDKAFPTIAGESQSSDIAGEISAGLSLILSLLF